ncbi:MAG: zinc ribbon domain-containing protein [Egibacteraceae bacterium]
MIAATRVQQRRLLDLQHIDTRIRQLRHRRANLPEQRALDDRVDLLDRIGRELAAARERLDRLARDQRRHERELESVEARYAAETQRKYSGAITSPKEATALDAELASMEQRKSDVEDTLLEIMEQREETESLIAALTEREAELAEEVATAGEARDHAAVEIRHELAQQVAERKLVAADLPETVLACYNGVRVRKEGLAVAELQGRTCAGCRLELTNNEMQQIRALVNRGLARCEQCDRILVVP